MKLVRLARLASVPVAPVLEVLRRSEGMLGEVGALLAAAMEAALLAGEERISRTALDAAAYQPPYGKVSVHAFTQELRDWRLSFSKVGFSNSH